jgi:pSer/pThr/pTyr-binding forkhead associated (FHA) protein
VNAAGAPVFGNGASVEDYLDDDKLSVASLQALSTWFLLARPRAAKKASEEWGDDPTGSIDSVSPRSPTGSFVGAAAGDRQIIFRVKRLPRSRFDFIAIGRNEGNDIFLPDASVSRFHAFFRETSDGKVLLQDVRSSNGTFARGLRVPRQGEGAPVLVNSGDTVRFGDIHGAVLDAESLFRLLRS